MPTMRVIGVSETGASRVTGRQRQRDRGYCGVQIGDGMREERMVDGMPGRFVNVGGDIAQPLWSGEWGTGSAGVS